MVAACGDGIALDADAVAPPDSDVGIVRVQYFGGVPAGNAVMFLNADSSLVLSTYTDPGGQANAFMRPGGSVTIVGATSNPRRLFTWLDVKPGDELVLDRGAINDSGLAEPFVVTLDPAEDAIFYRLFTSCGEFAIGAAKGNPSTVADLHRCGASTDMLALAYVNGIPQAYTYRRAVPLGTTGIELHGPYAPFEVSQIEVAGVDAAETRAVATRHLVDGAHTVYRAPPVELSLQDGIGVASQDMPLPDGAASSISLDLSGSATSAGRPHVVLWGAATPTIGIDLHDRYLRQFTSPAFHDRSTSAIRWAEDTHGKRADATLVRLIWSRPDTTETFEWELIGPHGETPELRLPVLPRDALSISEGDQLLDLQLSVIGLEGGYDRLRTRLLGAWHPGSPWPADSPSGSVMYQDLAPGAFTN
jgi:hypothetical protein